MFKATIKVILAHNLAISTDIYDEIKNIIISQNDDILHTDVSTEMVDYDTLNVW